MFLSKKNLSTFQKIEFQVFSFLFALAIVDILPLEIFSMAPKDSAAIWLTFLQFFLKALLIFIGFSLINFHFLPYIVQKKNPLLNLIFLAALLTILYFIFLLFTDIFLFLFFLIFMAIYSCLRYLIIFIYKHWNSIRSRFPYITIERSIIVFLGLTLILLFAGNAERETTVFVSLVIISAITINHFSFHQWIPRSLQMRNPIEFYFNKIVLVLVFSTIPVGALGLLLTNNPQIPVLLVGLNFIIQLLITAPITWWLALKNRKKDEQLLSLEKDLGQSIANIDFLRSQINPHFLFNALNTLYAAALNEGSERTSEGIQKLGDMMRFMLHENFKENIPLDQDVEYLKNYIDLQRIKTDPNPKVIIDVEIEIPQKPLFIAPMLLIPLVENAFKHGVSFRAPSPITIFLKCEENVLNLKVRNKIHLKDNKNSEKDDSGIGLKNLKQRLFLLYPGKYNLKIKESAVEFFVDLTVDLT